MFKVQPVRSPEYQKELAEALGGIHTENTVAFLAAETEDDCETVKYPIAMCEFSFAPEKAVIRSLAIAEGCEDDEAVTILVRAVMSWVNRADIPVIEFDDGAAEDELIRKLSFSRNEDGRYAIDLVKFYRSPCHYGKDQ